MFVREGLRNREVESVCSVNKVQHKLSDSSKISRFDMSTAFRGKFAKDMGFYVHAKEEQTFQKKREMRYSAKNSLVTRSLCIYMQKEDVTILKIQ